MVDHKENLVVLWFESIESFQICTGFRLLEVVCEPSFTQLSLPVPLFLCPLLPPPPPAVNSCLLCLLPFSPTTPPDPPSSFLSLPSPPPVFTSSPRGHVAHLGDDEDEDDDGADDDETHTQ